MVLHPSRRGMSWFMRLCCLRVCRCLKDWMNRKAQTSGAYAKPCHPTMSHVIIPQQCAGNISIARTKGRPSWACSRWKRSFHR